MVDVAEHIIDLPGNGWPDDPKLKRVGEFFFLDIYDGARGIGTYRRFPRRSLLVFLVRAFEGGRYLARLLE